VSRNQPTLQLRLIQQTHGRTPPPPARTQKAAVLCVTTVMGRSLDTPSRVCLHQKCAAAEQTLLHALACRCCRSVA
jgi:hypothetical protein